MIIRLYLGIMQLISVLMNNAVQNIFDSGNYQHNSHC